MRALIDGDILVYKYAYSANIHAKNSSYYYGVRILTNGMRNEIDRTTVDAGCSKCTVYLSPANGKSHRNDMVKSVDYKGNRSGTGKPFYYTVARDVLVSMGAIVVDGMEADDALGIAQGDDTVICTMDKDLRMVPGKHLLYKERTIEHIKDEVGYLNRVKGGAIKGGGFLWFALQALAGDKIDNIPGIRGVGPVKAYNTLKDATSVKEAWELVSGMYESNGDDTLIEQANLLWILQNEGEYFKDWLDRRI